MKLSVLLERALTEDEKMKMLSQTVKNPETGNDITVKTALGYPKNHPARKAASKIYAQFMNKTSADQKPAPDPATGPGSYPSNHLPLDPANNKNIPDDSPFLRWIRAKQEKRRRLGQRQQPQEPSAQSSVPSPADSPDADSLNKQSMLSQTVKDPETGNDITVKDALGYPKNHPVRKAAAKIYAQFMNKTSQKSAPKPTTGANSLNKGPNTSPAYDKSRSNPTDVRQQPQSVDFDDDDYYHDRRDDALTGDYYRRWRDRRPLRFR
jgi:phenylalanyl-tRNA synthetase alpha subunit